MTSTLPQPRTRRNDTRDRILTCALGLFNQEGFAQTSTNRIASELGISSGNLYHHFKNKEQIAEWLIRRFEDRIAAVTSSAESITALDDLWLMLHLMLEIIQEYRFALRDVDQLMRRPAKIADRLRRVTDRQLHSILTMCRRLAAVDILRAEPGEVDDLALQMVFTTTCWLTFERLLSLDAAGPVDLGRSAYQVLNLLSPYLDPTARLYLSYLRGKYTPRAPLARGHGVPYRSYSNVEDCT